MNTDPILRINEVQSLTKLSRSTIYRLLRLSTFPRPVALGARAVGWRASAIREWIEGLPSKAGAERCADARPRLDRTALPGAANVG